MPAACVTMQSMMKAMNDGRHPTNWSRGSRSTRPTSEKHALTTVTSILDRFRRATKIIMLLMRGFRQTKIYFKDDDSELKLQKRLRATILRETNDEDDDDEEEGRGRRSHAACSSSTKRMIGHQLYLCLTTIPHHRNDATIRQILWFLKAMKAFQNLFPVEMEQEVAKYVEYARFDEGRVIASQGRRPECLYFIISGRVKLVRQFRLLNGVVTKFMGYIGKGKTTDPDELIGLQWLREDTLVAEGQVEMLLLNKEVFAHLQHTTEVPPLDFIRSLPYFQRFPVENFLDNPDAIEYKYYGDGKIIVEDSNRTPWIYIIKSGFVRVVRCQMVKFHCHSGASFKDRCQWTKEGGGRTAAETSNNHSSRRTTYKKAVTMKFDINEIQLPKVSEVRLLKELHEPLKKRRQHSSPSIETEHCKSKNIETENRRKGNSKKRLSERLSRKFETIAEESLSTNDEREEVSSKDILPISSREPAAPDDTVRLLPVLSRPDKEDKQRLTFLQLDTLTAGDIFGLDHLHAAVASEPKGVSLVSGGAEVIQINKRFYMNDFGNDGLHATDSVCKEYISEKMAEEDLLNQEAWRRYKASVYRRATAYCSSHTSTNMTNSISSSSNSSSNSSINSNISSSSSSRMRCINR